MNIGVCSISNKEWPIADIIAVAGRLGVDGVEVWGEDHIGDGSQAWCEEIVDRAEAEDLELPVYGSYLRPGADSFVDELEHEVQITANLNADMIRVWAGNQEYQDVTESHWDAVVDDLNTLAETAAAHDIAVTVERHSGTVTNTTEGASRLIEETASNVGLNYQPYFPHSATEVSEDTAALADLTNNIHIQTVPTQGAGNRCPLAFSYFNISEIIESHRSAGFDGYIEIEFVTDRSGYTPALASDVAFLTELIGE